jgi:hypothetical protein
MTDDSFKVLVQIGYQKSAGRRPGQLVKAFICFRSGGEEEIQWSKDPEQGRYLSDRSHKNMAWFLASRSISDGDSIRVEIFTGSQGQGEDPNLTQKRIYLFDESAPVREFVITNVGFKRFPILKGRFHEVESVSKRDEIERELTEFIDDESQM